jgi:hypothetical protein
MRSRLAAATFALFAACATTGVKGDLDTLKPTLDVFHRRMRWKELRQIPVQLMPDRREAFTKACEARDDEKNLFVTDYQLEECKLLEDQTFAVCTSKVSWYRLPSANEKTVTVSTTLKWTGGVWLVDRQSDGPFVDAFELKK